MKFMSWGKDGGKDSPVEGLYIIEIKSLFSIVRGPWARTWREYRPATDQIVILANGRKEVGHINCAAVRACHEQANATS